MEGIAVATAAQERINIEQGKSRKNSVMPSAQLE
jgi:hypothetical protein